MPLQLITQTFLFGHFCHRYGFQVLLSGVSQELIHILRRKDYCHTLLRFGDGKLCSVQTGIFLRNFVQIDLQAVRQLTDGNGNAAGAEVVTFFDQTADFLSPEQSLNLSLCRRITFLYFRSRRYRWKR